MRGKILAHLVVLSLVMSSCGQAAVKPDNLPDLVTDHIITAYDHYYPGSTVELSVKLSITPKEIWFGSNWNLVKSANPPKDGIWKDKLILEKKKNSEMAITVVLNLEDGTKKNLVKSITVVDKPGINIEQERSSKTGDKLIVWADVELSKVEYIDPNGQTIPLVKNDKEFTLEQKLPEPGTPAGTIRTTDSLGVVEDKQIKASGIDEPRVYYIEHNTFKYDTINKIGIEKVMESSLDFSYKKVAFEIKLKQIDDPDLKYLCSITDDPTHDINYISYIKLRALSKDRKTAIITTKYVSWAKDNYIEDGKLMTKASVILTFTYNTITNKYSLLTKETTRVYKDYIKSTGSLLFPVFVDDSEILFVEQVRDGKTHNISNVNVKFVDFRSDSINPYAKAVAVSLSLKDMKLSPSDKVQPLSPWVAYADVCTGIVGYNMPFAKWRLNIDQNGALPDTFDEVGTTTVLSDIKGSKIINVDDLYDKFPGFSQGVSYYNLDMILPISTFKTKDDITVYLFVNFRNTEPKGEGASGVDPVQITKIFAYNQTNNLFDQIYQFSYNLNENDFFYCMPISSSFDLGKPAMLLVKGNLKGYLLTINSNPTEASSNNYMITDMYNGIFILPGGEQ